MKKLNDIPLENLDLEALERDWESQASNWSPQLKLAFGIFLQLISSGTSLKQRISLLRFFLIKTGRLKSSEKHRPRRKTKRPHRPPAHKDPLIHALNQKEYFKASSLYYDGEKQSSEEKAAAWDLKLQDLSASQSSPEQDGPMNPTPDYLPVGPLPYENPLEAMKLSPEEALGETAFAPDPAFARILEDISFSFTADLQEEHHELQPEAEELADLKHPRPIVEERKRYSFSFSLTEHTYKVTRYAGLKDGEEVIISPSMADIGPKGSVLTYEFITNLTMTVSQLYIPFSRLSLMLSTPEKRFSTSNLALWFAHSAEHLAPIYLELSKQLSNAAIISGDDTVPRCNEVNRYFEAVKLAETLKKTPPEKPWLNYQSSDAALECLRSIEQASETNDWAWPRDYLGALIGSELPFVSNFKNNNLKDKKGLYLSVATGCPDPLDPRSRIVLYRTHFGGAGNFITYILKHRTSTSPLILQGDMSPSNRLADLAMEARFNVRYAGCLAHARRPFKIHEHEDPDITQRVLYLFKEIAFDEDTLKRFGQTAERTLRVREIEGRTLEAIRKICNNMNIIWSKKTALGAAAHYVQKYFKELTLYLTEPLLEPTNNFCERMLRPEKKLQDAASFRTSLRGRFALDVNRSILQTAIAAGVDAQWYLNEIYRVPAAEIKANPSKYTPLAYLRAYEASNPDFH